MENPSLHHKIDQLLLAVAQLGQQRVIEAQEFGALKQEVNDLRQAVQANTQAIEKMDRLIELASGDRDVMKRLDDTVNQLVVSDAVQEERIKSFAQGAGMKAGAAGGGVMGALGSLAYWAASKILG